MQKNKNPKENQSRERKKKKGRPYKKLKHWYINEIPKWNQYIWQILKKKVSKADYG